MEEAAPPLLHGWLRVRKVLVMRSVFVELYSKRLLWRSRPHAVMSGAIDLLHAIVEHCDRSKRFSLRDGQTQIAFVARSAQDALAWVHALRVVIKDLKRGVQTSARPSAFRDVAGIDEHGGSKVQEIPGMDDEKDGDTDCEECTRDDHHDEGKDTTDPSSERRKHDQAASRLEQDLIRPGHGAVNVKGTLGTGAYGVVVHVEDERGRAFAVKQVSDAMCTPELARAALRELRLMRGLRHPNICALQDAYVRPTAPHLYLVLMLMESDLHRVLKSRNVLTVAHRQCIFSQIMSGIAFLHANNVLHRDIKPSNILVNSNCSVRICDLGMATTVPAPDHAGSHSTSSDYDLMLTEYVVTRWYRAPEIMLAPGQYGFPCDIWSAGCVLAEILRRKPLFRGATSSRDQLRQIVRVLGKPTAEVLKTYDKNARQFLSRIPDKEAIPLEDVCDGRPHDDPPPSDDEIDLLSRMLMLDSAARIDAEGALAHDYIVPTPVSECDTIYAPKPAVCLSSAASPNLRPRESFEREIGLLHATNAVSLGASSRLKDWRFVVVDDADIDRMVAVRQLQDLGIPPSQIEEYDDGEAFAGSTIDATFSRTVVIMDMNMPMLNGDAAAQRVINGCEAARVPPPLFVCTTGDGPKPATDTGVFADVLTKPVLASKFERLLSSSSPLWSAEPGQAVLAR